MTKLTAKQERFCREYIIDLNATQAAIRAGYSEKTAAEQGVRLLRNVKVKEKIQYLQRKLTKRVEITQENIVNELASIGFAEPSKYVRTTDKIKALELLGKHLGIFTEKMQIEGDIKTDNPYKNLTTDDLLKLARDNG